MDQVSHSRREFIKGVGVALAALVTARCRLAKGSVDTVHDRLRDCWQRLDGLAEETQGAQHIEQGEKARDQLAQDHLSALNALVASGDLERDVAAQVQTAFAAAVYHVWRSNAPITCYEPVLIDYKPTSSGQLARQAGLLAQSDDLDHDTVAMAQAAIARDVAFLNLSGDEVQVLYDKLAKVAGDSTDFPSFDELELDVSPEAVEAARFLVALLLAE